jgi:hypothetical protein
MILFIIATLLLLQVNAFAPRTSFSPASVVQGVQPPSRIMTPFVLGMSEENNQVDKVSTDGTFYDDEVSRYILSPATLIESFLGASN